MQERGGNEMKKLMFVTMTALLSIGMAACSEKESVENAQVENGMNQTETNQSEEAKPSASEQATSETSGIELTHVHGIGFSEDGKGLYIPSHDGLKVFEKGTWKEASGEPHDYMGFAMVDDGFYSSGHPGVGSSLKNPFGIIKTTDMGETLKMLDLYQEVDFHGMAVGYYSHAIYVLNPAANSRMSETGLYFSTDDTKSWTKSDMTGLQGSVFSIAVHPTNEAIVAFGTNEGVFLSKDYGKSFVSIVESPTTAVTFSAKGELFAGLISDKAVLTTFNSETNEPITLSIPSLSQENAITYLAINPQNDENITFATVEKDIYMTQDSGGSWSQIADKGKVINLKADITQ